jgi:hypothetical protein
VNYPKKVLYATGVILAKRETIPNIRCETGIEAPSDITTFEGSLPRWKVNLPNLSTEEQRNART